LVGAGAEATTLRGSGQVRVFDVGPQGDVTLRDLEITGGVEKQQARKGGAGIMVWDGGRLTVERCLITDNYAAEGAGIVVSRHATLTLLDTDVEHNTAFGVGGGLIAREESTVTIKAGTRIAENHARIWAGGILAEEGSVVTLEAGSQVTRNSSDNPGGGILSRRATVRLAGPSIVTSNVPDNCGGAGASPIESCVG
ncbi:MAG: right-handed parallel beta-helix repeat-containing protein, partial [Thermomicrobiales bacterium]|nr:right-handed parallel beta-helix repeat-containing protein [Thermomicrobiales bacterium]